VSMHHLGPELPHETAQRQRNANVEPAAEKICAEERYVQSASLIPEIRVLLRHEAQGARTPEASKKLKYMGGAASRFTVSDDL